MSIPALRIEVNGELVAVAGADGLSTLCASLGFSADKGKTLDSPEAMFMVMGLAVDNPQPRSLTWAEGVKLKMGDKVTFELVETEDPSPPDNVLASPSSAQLKEQAMAKRRSPRPAQRRNHHSK